MNTEEMKALLEQHTVNLTQFWETKLAHWKAELLSRQTHMAKKLEDLERTVSNGTFAAAVSLHSSPRPINSSNPFLLCDTDDIQLTSHFHAQEEDSEQQPQQLQNLHMSQPLPSTSCLPPPPPSSDTGVNLRQTPQFSMMNTTFAQPVMRNTVDATFAASDTLSYKPPPLHPNNSTGEVLHGGQPLTFPSESTRLAFPEIKRPTFQPHVTGISRYFNPSVVQPYDGTASWSDYERQFEIVAQFHGWTESEKAHGLAMQLRGEALSVLSAMPRGKPLLYEVLRDLLRQRFSWDDHTSYTLLRNRLQRPKESLAEFAIHLQRLAASAFPDGAEKVVEEIVLSQFIEGIRDDQIQNLVAVGRPHSLSEALKIAQEISSRFDRRAHKHVLSANTSSNEAEN